MRAWAVWVAGGIGVEVAVDVGFGEDVFVGSGLSVGIGIFVIVGVGVEIMFGRMLAQAIEPPIHRQMIISLPTLPILQ